MNLVLITIDVHILLIRLVELNNRVLRLKRVIVDQFGYVNYESIKSLMLDVAQYIHDYKELLEILNQKKQRLLT